MLYLIAFFFNSVFASEVAITIDDFNYDNNRIITSDKRDALILATLRKYNIKAVGFVTTKYLKSDDLLKTWSNEGHIIGNHTHNHWNYHKTSFSDFSQDILETDKLLSKYKSYQKIFRFPYLKEGESEEKRDQLRSFLKANGFKNGGVTIDASDWYINNRLVEKLEKNSSTEISKYKEFYLKHLWERSIYYSDLAKKVLGKDVKHTLLLHHNLTTAYFLDDLITMYKDKGWKVIDATEAFKDDVYKRYPKNTPAGEGIIWALAKESKKFEDELRYPAEGDQYEKEEMDVLGL